MIEITLKIQMKEEEIRFLQHPHETSVWDTIIQDDLRKAEKDHKYYLIAQLKLRYFEHWADYYTEGLDYNGETEGRILELDYFLERFLKVPYEELEQIKKMAYRYVHDLRIPSTAGFRTAWDIMKERDGYEGERV